MHESVMSWVQDECLHLPRGGKVLEVGSRNVNGSIRPIVERLVAPISYMGVDLEGGDGVDLVLPGGIESLPECRPGYDLVVSCEMLEHAERWEAAFRAMARILAPGGTLLLTCRGPGFARHNCKSAYEGDYWRFTVDELEAAAICCGLRVRGCVDDWQVPGVFLRAERVSWPSPMPEPGWVRRSP